MLSYGRYSKLLKLCDVLNVSVIQGFLHLCSGIRFVILEREREGEINIYIHAATS